MYEKTVYISMVEHSENTREAYEGTLNRSRKIIQRLNFNHNIVKVLGGTSFLCRRHVLQHILFRCWSTN